MRKSSAVLGSALFFLAAPGSIAGLMPWWIGKWGFTPEPAWYVSARAAGVLMIAAGMIFLVESFARFALEGIGTPAPIAPTKHLVVTGYYRYVRNPMYVAVLAIILGQALLFANLALAAYAVIVCAAFSAFVMAYEEPALKRQFGDEYVRYRANVPRWIPRLRPWRAAATPGR